MTEQPTPGRSSGRRLSAAPRPRIGLALAGGGPLGAIYEIGALAALSESLEGVDFNDIDVYVGVSAGGFIAAGLANGITPHQMSRAFIEGRLALSAGNEHDDERVRTARPCDPDRSL